jgi:hypothetical protein
MLEIAFGWGVISVVAGLLIAAGLSVLSMNPPETQIANILFSVGFLLLLIKLCAWEAFERSDPFAQRALFIGFVCAAGGVLWFACITLANSKVRTNGPQVLTFDAVDINISYPEGDNFGGIEWKPDYRDTRLTIKNTSDKPIQNINLTAQIIDDENSVLWDMGQVSTIPGVEFRPPEIPELRLQLQGKDGSTSVVTSNDMFAQANHGKKMPSVGKQYGVFCPRLFPDLPLRLALATGPKEKRIEKIKVFGTYELMPSEGSQPVKVSEIVSVSTK